MSILFELIDTLPTAYSEDVNKFYKRGCPEKRDNLMIQLKENMLSKGKNYNQSFPNRTKRKDVLGYILLLTSVSGMVAVESKTIADRVGCSVDYVFRTVKNIKETGEFIVTGLADGSNKYVFVLKSHENFKQILQEVFYIDIPEQVTEQITEPEKATNVDTTNPNDDFSRGQSLQSFKSLSSRQESNIYIANAVKNVVAEEIENVTSLIGNIIQEKEYISTYFVSEFQHEVYNYIKNNEFHADINKVAAIIGLRTGSNSGRLEAVKAIQVLFKINSFLIQGGRVREGIPALFMAMFKKGLSMDEYAREYKVKQQREALEIQHKQQALPAVPKVEFYDWIAKRE